MWRGPSSTALTTGAVCAGAKLNLGCKFKEFLKQNFIFKFETVSLIVYRPHIKIPTKIFSVEIKAPELKLSVTFCENLV